MANNFKSDESFLRNLVVGAAGTNATILRLKELGFNPIELERGSSGYKIWKKIKIKRIRVPDILCLNTGLRFESRGKTKLEISMSHSRNDPKRAWDAGMRDDDYVSLMEFKQKSDSLIDLEQISPVHFIRVRDLRDAFAAEQVKITEPKGVEEGSEIRVVWMSAKANQKSIVKAIQPDKVFLEAITDAKPQRIKLQRNKGKIILIPQVKVEDVVETNQIVASIVPVYTRVDCPQTVSEYYFIEKLESVNLSERYAAAKALRYRGYLDAKQILGTRIKDLYEDIYVQLEAAAALAAYDDENAWEFIESKLRSSTISVPLETQLETVIVVSEIHTERSQKLLIEVMLDNNRNEELRAGAAWALGQFSSKISATALVNTFNSNSVEIKSEAARALQRIAEPHIPHLLELLQKGDPNNRDGISWALAKTGNFNPVEIIPTGDDNLRRWISYIIGYGRDNFDQADLEAICNEDPQIYFAASVLWQIVASWVSDLREY